MKKIILPVLMVVALIAGVTQLSAESPCQGLAKDQCTSNDKCSWHNEGTRKDGGKIAAHCQAKPGQANGDKKDEPKKDPKKDVKKDEPKKDPKHDPKHDPKKDVKKDEPKKDPKKDVKKDEPKKDPKHDPKKDPKKDVKKDDPMSHHGAIKNE
ncbi:MAG: hypothetical protein HY042_03620 [Spirochaetia bacterium]|nr:hypothetical protein [Spirochaetia bacterium]